MSNAVFIIVYSWLSVLFLWYGRYARAGIGEKPLILTSAVVQFLFNLIAAIWIITTIYVAIFVDWKLVIIPLLILFLIRFFKRLTSMIEDIALLPFNLLVRKNE